ncbi:D-alanyl-D-alanine carboxypeptidase precursor [Phycisphaerae bacterium RAS2]|nr:D-alanyl-D-alanine carboxypeptidase precursor [Phycisphaerae bacterium RAS2]
MMRGRLPTICIASVIHSLMLVELVIGQTTRPAADDVTAILKDVIKKDRVPGMAAAVVRSKGPIVVGVAGKREARGKQKIAADDRFHLGSCTKSMTATLCAMLVEQGKLKWETTVAEAFGEQAEKLNSVYRTVTLKQLLCHRAGLAEDRRPDLATWPKVLLLSGDMLKQRRSLVEIVLSREPAHEPDTKFAYSNYGFAIAGAMCEAVTGEAYEALMKQMMFEPLGMTTAGFGAPGSPDEVDQPRGHDSLFMMYSAVPPGPGSDNPAVIGPAGTAHCSVGDWAKYARLHLRGARKPESAELLKPATFELLHADPYKQEYAFGWVIRDEEWAGGKMLAHDGSNGRWYAVVVIAPQRDLAILVATNAADDTAQSAIRGAIRKLREAFK